MAGRSLGNRLITLDTSGLFAAMVRTDVHLHAAVAEIDSEPGPIFLPAAILCELGYLLDREFGAAGVTALLADIESGAFVLECGGDDLPRIRELVTRYADLRLGYSDATVISCAERHWGRVLTFDLRHFGVVAREERIQLAP